MDELRIGNTLLYLAQGDITKIGTEAIVNAANEALAGGGGVDGAIHRAAGPELYGLTAQFDGCPTGSAIITTAGRIPLPTRYIIHAVGPIYDFYPKAEAQQLLAGAYRKSLELAQEKSLKSIAFPSIATGVYGYPIREAALVVLETVIAFLKEKPTTLEEIVFVLFSVSDLAVYERAMAQLHP